MPDTHQDKRRTRWVIPVLSIALVAAGIGFSSSAGVHYAGVTDYLQRMDLATLLAAMAVLPIIGFPVTAVYFVSGARFGPLEASGLVTALTAIHLLGTHLVARTILSKPLQRLLARHRHRLPAIPPNAGTSVSAVVVLLPGIPYFIRNLFLALSGIRLPTYLSVCIPLYVARSYLAIFVGDFGMHPSARQLAMICFISAIQLTACAALLRRLQRA